MTQGEADGWPVGMVDTLRPGLTDQVNVLTYARAYCNAYPGAILRDVAQFLVTLSPNA
jgi:hypothetical protein